ncbi:MAG: patatin-like phospholipase family protein [Proteobacteria bacterium]|uniref:phospholipase n=1 Tax=Aquabacterium sp. TaxID=1872578 RepID=UPI0035C67952|nr:patatin-like phospholipase family protein [Pseudomonadota bacterium]
MKALHIHVGERARAHIASQGLRPQDVRLVPAAAGGPKGLMLTHLDQHLFGRWLPTGGHTVHLVGASIGAWRMATAAMPDPGRAFADLAHGYIHQHIEPEPGRQMPSAARITAGFTQTLQDFFGRDVEALLSHPRWRLHVLTAKGRQILRRNTLARTAAGFAGLALTNALSRQAVGLFLERHVFSSPGEALPVPLRDLPTQQLPLTPENFLPAMLASCSIPFMLEGVPHIPGAQPGAHWDGGLVDYHVHWPYNQMDGGLVLYPHFQRQVVPGWLDKGLRWRHRATPALSNMVLLCPNPEWVRTLPGGKLPDRTDFKALLPAERMRVWSEAVAQAEQLSEEWQQWLDDGCPADVLQPL